LTRQEIKLYFLTYLLVHPFLISDLKKNIPESGSINAEAVLSPPTVWKDDIA